MTAGRARRLLIPGLSALAMLAVLLFLGTWQVERLAWKRGLLAAIAQAELRPPVPLAGTPAMFTRVRAQGRFAAASGLYGAEVREVAGGTVGGAHLLGVLLRDGAPAVLVDRGWVPVPPPPIQDGPAIIDGYLRPPAKPGLFTPDDDLAGRRFYTLDPAAIGAALGTPGLAPYVLVAMGPPPPPGQPDPARTMPRPTNNHLSYALTWYGLAAALAVIFVLYARKVLRP